jgi:hypothetical protein
LDKHGARIIGGNMSGQNARELSTEFRASRQLRQDIKKPVWHQALSLPPGDHIGDGQWKTIAHDYMQQMGFRDQNQWVAVLHQDKGHQHIHIIASRIGLDGKIWYGQDENLESTRIVQGLERKHGLTITKGPDDSEAKPKLSQAERDQATRLKAEHPKLILAAKIDEALKDAKDKDQFLENLDRAGVTVHFNQSATTGRISGVSYELHNSPEGFAKVWKGSQLGKAYSWPSVEQRLIWGPDWQPSEVKGKQSPRYPRTLDRLQVRQANDQTIYSWQSGAVALVDRGDTIQAGKSDAAIRALIQLAKDKGWTQLEISRGNQEWREKLWLEAQKAGLQVQNHVAGEEAKRKLREWQEEHQSKRYGRTQGGNRMDMESWLKLEHIKIESAMRQKWDWLGRPDEAARRAAIDIRRAQLLEINSAYLDKIEMAKTSEERAALREQQKKVEQQQIQSVRREQILEWIAEQHREKKAEETRELERVKKAAEERERMLRERELLEQQQQQQDQQSSRARSTSTMHHRPS